MAGSLLLERAQVPNLTQRFSSMDILSKLGKSESHGNRSEIVKLCRVTQFS